MSAPAHLRKPSDGLIHVAGLLLATGIFAIDAVQPIDGSVGVLYVLPVVLGLWTSWRAYPLVAALVATGLLILDTLADWTPTAPASTYVNRPVMTLAFVTTAVLVARFKRVEGESKAHLLQLEDLKRALDSAAIVATTDVAGRITYVNDKFCEISEYSREYLLGQDHRVINSGLHPKEFMRNLWRTIASGRVWHGEIRNRAMSGRLYWVDTTIIPFLDARGKPYQYIAIRSDITARKAAEESLRQQAALARMGQMAAVVAHEVRNPLAGIKGALQVLLSRRAPGDGEVPVMRDIVTRIDALSELIDDMMVFARPRPLRLGAVELRQVLTEAVTFLRRDPAGQQLGVTVEGPEFTLTADASLLKGAILNLMLNAAQAMGGEGTLALVLEDRSGQAAITIRDSGPGIPAELMEQIFEPFFTTKARGGGLGLAVARRTVELHGGTLTLDCPPDGGTRATLILPRQPPSAGGPASAPPA